MKTAAAILAAAMLLQDRPPEKVSLFWKPPADRIVVVTLSTSTSTGDPDSVIHLKAEAELHPQGEAKKGLSFLLKGTRYFLENSDVKNRRSFLYERGKEPDIRGKSLLDAQATLRLKDDIKITITDQGLRHIDRGPVQPFAPVSTGVLELQLPPTPVKEGASWVSFTSGFPFKGKLQYTVKSITRDKMAKIDVKILPEDFPDGENMPSGNGEFTFSFEDGLISSSTFTMVGRNRGGTPRLSFHQTMSQKLKPQ